jgi:outer membrane protein OmpA-like peptidoglycan-associated protein
MIGLLGGVGYLFRNGVSTHSPSMAANQTATVYRDSLLQVPAAKKIIDMVDPAKRSSDMKESSGEEQAGVEKEPSEKLGTAPRSGEMVPSENSKFTVFFKHNSNQLPQQTLETLNRIINLAADHPLSTITITGYTDSHGDRLYNVMLSAERANRVKAYLVQGGVPASKIKVFGKGPENPIESNATLEGRKKNRRVEIELSMEDNEEGRHLTA